MCGELVSCANFRAILTPFREVIETLTLPSKRMERQTTPSNLVPRVLSLPRDRERTLGTRLHSIHRWPDVTPQIAFSSKGKVLNCNKNNSSTKPNKFHSKYMCFSGRKTCEEGNICLKIRLFGFPSWLSSLSLLQLLNR